MKNTLNFLFLRMSEKGQEMGSRAYKTSYVKLGLEAEDGKIRYQKNKESQKPVRSGPSVRNAEPSAQCVKGFRGDTELMLVPEPRKTNSFSLSFTGLVTIIVALVRVLLIKAFTAQQEPYARGRRT